MLFSKCCKHPYRTLPPPEIYKTHWTSNLTTPTHSQDALKTKQNIQWDLSTPEKSPCQLVTSFCARDLWGKLLFCDVVRGELDCDYQNATPLEMGAENREQTDFTAALILGLTKNCPLLAVHLLIPSCLFLQTNSVEMYPKLYPTHKTWIWK